MLGILDGFLFELGRVASGIAVSIGVLLALLGLLKVTTR